MKKIAFLLTLVFLFGVTPSACSQAPQNPAQQTEDTFQPTPVLTEEQLRQDIGEILLVGFRGTTITAKDHIVRDIQEYHVGNVILFEYDAPTGTRHRNVSSPEQIQKLCHDLQQYGKGQLLIGIDQEGGNVARLRVRDGFPSTITAQQSALKGDSAVKRNAAIVAGELTQAGINLNFAPCVDVNVNPHCPVIGGMGRSFSDDPAVVSRCARIWIDVQKASGIVSCLKHFPGHGSAKGDTHSGLVDVTKTYEREKELQPYKDLIAAGDVDMIMVAHVINKQLGDDLPASLSPTIVTELLRKQMGFQGVIVTDDLAMGAITRHYGFEEGIKLAILAGCDMLCLSNNGGGYSANMVPRAVEAIVQYVNNGELSAEQIHISAERIRALKKRMIKK